MMSSITKTTPMGLSTQVSLGKALALGVELHIFCNAFHMQRGRSVCFIMQFSVCQIFAVKYNLCFAVLEHSIMYCNKVINSHHDFVSV